MAKYLNLGVHEGSIFFMSLARCWYYSAFCLSVYSKILPKTWHTRAYSSNFCYSRYFTARLGKVFTKESMSLLNKEF